MKTLLAYGTAVLGLTGGLLIGAALYGKKQQNAAVPLPQLSFEEQQEVQEIIVHRYAAPEDTSSEQKLTAPSTTKSNTISEITDLLTARDHATMFTAKVSELTQRLDDVPWQQESGCISDGSSFALSTKRLQCDDGFLYYAPLREEDGIQHWLIVYGDKSVESQHQDVEYQTVEISIKTFERYDTEMSITPVLHRKTTAGSFQSGDIGKTLAYGIEVKNDSSGWSSMLIKEVGIADEENNKGVTLNEFPPSLYEQYAILHHIKEIEKHLYHNE